MDSFVLRLYRVMGRQEDLSGRVVEDLEVGFSKMSASRGLAKYIL